LTDGKFVGAVAVVIVTIAAVFGVNWTEAGVEAWIAEVVGIITALAGGLYALKRGTDKTGTDDTE
jgi:cadmium resistance protein CadD (predicted permease)